MHPRLRLGIALVLAGSAACSSPPPPRTTVSGRVVNLYTGRGLAGFEVQLRHFRHPANVTRTDATGAYQFKDVAADPEKTYAFYVVERPSERGGPKPIRKTETAPTARLRTTDTSEPVSFFDVKVTGSPVEVPAALIEDLQQVRESFGSVCQDGRMVDAPLLGRASFESTDGKTWTLTGPPGKEPVSGVLCIQKKTKKVGTYLPVGPGKGSRDALEAIWVVRFFRSPDGPLVQTTLTQAPPAYALSDESNVGDPMDQLKEWLAGIK